MKLYTGTGDRGKTSLFSGERRPKNHARIEAYGAVDELSACLGALAAAWPSPPDGNISDENLSSQSGSQAPAWSLEQIAEIQSDLFTAGAWLATTPQSAERDTLAPLDPDRSRWLEQAMDRMETQLPPLRNFILPGGHPAAAWAHLARTVCRRAERRVVGIAASEGAPDDPLGPIVIYLNRLSDYLFMLARWSNRALGVTDRPWTL